MRKLYLLIFLLVIGFIGNYFLWFFETRAINNMLNSYKNELRHHNIYLKHGDIEYSSFKSWNINGKIEDVEVTYNMASPRIINVDKLRFSVDPFSKTIDMKVNEKISISYVQYDGDREKYNIVFDDYEKLPKLKLKLNSSFQDVIDVLQQESAPKLTIISKLQYSNGSFKMLSQDDDKLSMSSGDNLIELTAISGHHYSGLDVLIDLKDIELINDKYFSKESIDLGKNSYFVDATYKQIPSDKILKKIEQDPSYDVVFDAYSVEARKIEQSTKLYSTIISGYATRQPENFIPYFDFDVLIKNYKMALDYSYKKYNNSIANSILGNSVISLKKINASSASELTEFAEKTGVVEGDNLRVSLIHDRGSNIKIGGRDVMDVAFDLQKILVKEK